jgi:hypothetical protein
MTRNGSAESLAAHPLLSPSSTSQQQLELSGSPTAPRYVPYTPRTRVGAPSAATTGTAAPSVAVSAPTQQHPGDARARLQLMNLKAATQKIGLDTNSVGWVMLEKLVGESEHNAEWTPVWDAIITSKVNKLPLKIRGLTWLI